jgi:hypothetical protein
LLSKLQVRYEQACEEARVKEYEAEAQVLDEESIQLAQEYRETCPPALNKLSDLFTARHRDEDDDQGSLADIVLRTGHLALRARKNPASRHLSGGA